MIMVNPLIDEATIDELRSTLGDDFLPELINTYLQETPLLIQDLQQALKDGNAPAFTRAAHSIKSSSASLGALGFSAQAKELEMTGKAGDLSQASAKVSELVNAYPDLEQAMKSLL
jgi:HPt (histidine-containing phosphotransfer) domain-containing protein